MLAREVLHLPNLELSYLIAGKGSEPLLLLHGMADSAMVWASLMEHLSDRYCIVAPDLRGHGDSSKDSIDYSFDRIIADLEALMQHIGWSSAHILSHSWSAKTAAIWAARNSDRFRSLILVDPFFMGKFPAWFRATFPLMYRVLPFLKIVGTFPDYATVEKIARTLKQYQGWTELQQQVFLASVEAQSDGSWHSKFPLQARNLIFEEIMRVGGLTTPIHVPTLFVKPKQGLNRSPWQIKPYQDFCLNLKIVEVAGNHWAFLGEPQTFNKEIEVFLSSVLS